MTRYLLLFSLGLALIPPPGRAAVVLADVSAQVIPVNTKVNNNGASHGVNSNGKIRNGF